MKNEFQYRLLKAMADKQISASELSRLSGVGKSDISNYVNGVYVAKQDKCFLLARALGVDPGWLMTGDEPKKFNLDLTMFGEHDATPQTDEARILAKGIDKLSPEERAQALAVVKAMFAQHPELFKD